MSKSLYDCLMSEDVQSIFVKSLGPQFSSETVGNVYVSCTDSDYEFPFDDVQSQGGDSIAIPIGKLAVKINEKFIPERITIGALIRFTSTDGQHYDCVKPLVTVQPVHFINIIQGYGRVSLSAARECETLMRFLV
mgnify:CR=1 FL=1